MEKLIRIGEFIVADPESKEEVMEALMDKGFVIGIFSDDDPEDSFEVLKKK